MFREVLQWALEIWMIATDSEEAAKEPQWFGRKKLKRVKQLRQIPRKLLGNLSGVAKVFMLVLR